MHIAVIGERIFLSNTKVAIDATGDANVATLAGYSTVKSNPQQPATPQNHISGYVFEDIDLEQLHSEFAKANFPSQILKTKLEDALNIISLIYIFRVKMPKHLREKLNLNMIPLNSC